MELRGPAEIVADFFKAGTVKECRTRLCTIGGVGHSIKRQCKACLFDGFPDDGQSRSGFMQVQTMIENTSIGPVMIIDLTTRKYHHTPGKGHRLHPLDHQDQRRAALRIVAENYHGGCRSRGRHDFAGDGVDQ